MGCRASRPREAGDEAGQRTEKEQIHSTLNALKKHSDAFDDDARFVTRDVSKIGVGTHTRVERRAVEKDIDGRRWQGKEREEGDAATSDFLIAKCSSKRKRKRRNIESWTRRAIFYSRNP